jgi:hypothetical protein
LVFELSNPHAGFLDLGFERLHLPMQAHDV